MPLLICQVAKLAWTDPDVKFKTMNGRFDRTDVALADSIVVRRPKSATRRHPTNVAVHVNGASEAAHAVSHACSPNIDHLCSILHHPKHFFL